MNNFLFGNSHCCYYETICGGSGAGRDFNGTTVQCHMTNTRITDIEYLEKVYPVIVWQFNERKGSGGKGKHHGGDGVIREIQFTEEVTVSILSERRVYSAYGLKGGENGLVGRNVLIDRNGVQKSIGGKNTITVKKF
jgi:N-methylhydantoinase B/oxoprolinase/acetone carboxylase alpha subunit